MALINTLSQLGKTYQVNQTEITPIVKITKVQPPGMWGVLLWHRPFAVVVQNPGIPDEVVHIKDPTREAQFLLLGISLVGSLLITLFYKSTFERKEKND